MKKVCAACTVLDCTWIKAAPERVFHVLTDGQELSHWWPKSAESEPRSGGRLKLVWSNGSTHETAFERLIKNRRVSFPFYDQHIIFKLSRKKSGTSVEVIHACSRRWEVHVASCWGFLMGNLKAYIEHDVDLRVD